MLEKRETPMRFSAILHVITGAKWGLKSRGQEQPDYLGVLKLLIEKGEWTEETPQEGRFSPHSSRMFYMAYGDFL